MDYVFHVLVFIGIYYVLAESLDLVAGQAGLVSLAHAAFYGIGAYSAALMAVAVGALFIIGIIVGMTIAAVVSIVVSLPSLRVRDDYFVLASLAFQMMLYAVLNNWVELTRGPLGIPGIPRPSVLGYTFETPFAFLMLTGALATLSYGIIHRISTSGLGRVLRAIREDEGFACALGKNTLRVKVTVFATSAALAALAGGLYAHYIAYVDPTSFTLTESILILAMVIVGGSGSPLGPLVGATLLVTLPEALRLFGVPGAIAAIVRQIIYGLVLVVMMILRPRGLRGYHDFGR